MSKRLPIGSKVTKKKVKLPTSSALDSVNHSPTSTATSSVIKVLSDPFKEAVECREKLRTEWNKGEKGRNILLIAMYLEEAKLKLINLKYLERKGTDIPPSEQTLARDILEIGVLYSVLKEVPDIPMFERYMSQLKPYYFDYGDKIPASPHKYEMLGANLLCLLTEGHLGRFHLELERILHPIEKAQDIMEDIYIKRAIELEKAVEEGRYGQIHAQDGPQKNSGLWRYFVDKLTKSIQSEIADTMELAYEKLSIKVMIERLKFDSGKELENFAKQRNWRLHVDGFYYFHHYDPKKESVPSIRLLNEFLGYARELEIIV